MMFAIEALYHVGYGSNWERLPDQNGYETKEEAEQAIEQLRMLGEDWAAGKYRVVEQ